MPGQVEYNHCLTFWDWVRWRPELKRYVDAGLIFHVANERKATPRQGARLKAIGVRRGVADYLCLVPRGGFHGLAIEMKRPKGGSTTPYQDAFLTALSAEGYRAEVCAGAEEAIGVASNYFGL